MNQSRVGYAVLELNRVKKQNSDLRKTIRELRDELRITKTELRTGYRLARRPDTRDSGDDMGAAGDS